MRNKRKFWIDSILGTVFIFVLLVFAGRLFKVFDVLDPIGDALEDIEITDIVFSELRELPPVDTSIVIVNFGNLPRDGIAALINIINEDNPKVIGIDAFFKQRKDSLADLQLRNALARKENVVLVSKLGEYDEEADEFKSIVTSNPYFTEFTDQAYANLATKADNQDQYKICRSFPPKETVNDELKLAFGSKLAGYIDKEAQEKFLSRNNPTEIINYRGNVMDFGRSNFGTRFFALDWINVLQQEFEPGTFTDKIVLIGYLGDNFSDPSWDDKFYTPLNKDYAGKTNPDMFGVVIHANIISMILNQDYLAQMSPFTGLIIGIILCYLNVCLFIQILRKMPKWYDGLTKLIQLTEVILIFYIIVVVFNQYNYKMNLTIAIITILLAGDTLEIYFGVIKNVFSLKRIKGWFSKRKHYELEVAND